MVVSSIGRLDDDRLILLWLCALQRKGGSMFLTRRKYVSYPFSPANYWFCLDETIGIVRCRLCTTDIPYKHLGSDNIFFCYLWFILFPTWQFLYLLCSELNCICLRCISYIPCVQYKQGDRISSMQAKQGQGSPSEDRDHDNATGIQVNLCFQDFNSWALNICRQP